jgi:23S rRNA pseudouridine1911/1915/1917 synthase
MHGRTPVEVLADRVRRLGSVRALRVVAAGDLRVVTQESTRVAEPTEQLARGTVLELWRLAPDRPEDVTVAPSVLWEAEGLIVLCKPGDLAVHPSARYLHNTVTAWLRRRETPAHPCHRLDRETSGVLVCANDKDAERRWKQAFAAGLVQKTYLAVVAGAVERAFVIDRPLALQGERGLVRIRVIVDENGQPACTRVEPVQVSADGRRTLVRCFPETGRQHQIRAHLSSAGYPIVGDKLYQMGDAWFDAFTRRALDQGAHRALPCARQCLHAARLRFASFDFEAPLPDDMRRVLAGDSALSGDAKNSDAANTGSDNDARIDDKADAET